MKGQPVTMPAEWTLVDHTVPNGGYLQLQRGGKRVCDFFPFARGSDEKWVRAQAEIVMRTMNNAPRTL